MKKATFVTVAALLAANTSTAIVLTASNSQTDNQNASIEKSAPAKEIMLQASTRTIGKQSA